MGIWTAAPATLDTVLFISHVRSALVETVASLQDDGRVIPVSEVHELLTKIQHCEIWG